MLFNYRESVSMDDVPVLGIGSFRYEILRHDDEGWRILALFGYPYEGGAGLFAVMANDVTRQLFAVRTAALTEYDSLTNECPQVHLFEREIYESWGIMPKGHPWLKPVRFCPPILNQAGSRQPVGDIDFHRIHGEHVHEVAVGPVHAGIIEPGHFRFQCHGEQVMFLEISLGYQHRGIERMLLNGPDARTLHFMECTAGDTTIGHTTAYATAIERLCGVELPLHIHRARSMMLELERLANHTGDLGAIAGDTGFLPTSAWNGRIRGDFLNLTALFCGNRFGRGFIVPGGVACPCEPTRCSTALERLAPVYRDARGAVDVMFDSPSVVARMAHTGIVPPYMASELGLIGVALRACGIPIDARSQFPLYDGPWHKPADGLRGDVYSRAYVRSQELDASAEIARQHLEALRDVECDFTPVAMPEKLPANRLAVAQVEGWRGEVCHIAVTDAEGKFNIYKIVDPSFRNWKGLTLALRDQEISDFPLCNKSFNLSYCGHDL